jgi:phosphatidylserine/phosphatidylglycerophosphate/cardiolipin synthase-like enzyme
MNWSFAGSKARQSIRMPAYSFTSKDIARALVDARKRGVDVRVVLDDSQKPEQYTGATFLRTPAFPREQTRATPSCTTNSW